LREEGQGYALVTEFTGARMCKIYSYSTGQVDLAAYILKHNKQITKGDVILYRERSYQKNKVDITHVFSETERMTLLELEELTSNDILDFLPVEIFDLHIIKYLRLHECLPIKRVCSTWNEYLRDSIHRKFDVLKHFQKLET